MNPRSRPLADNQVYAKIFHRRVQHFFYRRLQAMNFIEEENFLGFERSQNRGQVALALQQRTRAGFDRHNEFVRDDLRQRGLAQSRRPVEQHVIQRLAAAPRRLDRDLDVLFDALLADVFVQAFWANARFDARVLVEWRSRHNSLRLSWRHHPFCCSFSHLCRHTLESKA